MYARIATIIPVNKDDWDILPTFVHELRTHSMHRFITEDLLQRPGFFKKEYVMTHDLTGQVFTSYLIFKDKDSFDNYMSEEANSSLYVYLEILANQKGLEINIEDREI